MLNIFAYPAALKENPVFSAPTARTLILLSIVIALSGCGSGSSSSSSGGGGSCAPVTGQLLTLNPTTVLLPLGGGTATISYSMTPACANPVLQIATVLPNTITMQIGPAQTSGNQEGGTITFTASSAVAASTATANFALTSSVGAETQPVTIVVAPMVTVTSSVDTSLGINGQLKQFMSTSFQPAEWDYQFFQNHPTSEPQQLAALAPQHIRLQGVSEAVPWKANSNPQQATDWDFTILDAIVQPVLTVGDGSPEFQIAVTPSFFTLSSPLSPSDPNLALFVSYAQNLVRYYNKGGFTWGGTTFASPSSHPVTWWGIYNEYNINGLTPSDYVVLYNAVVPAMLQVDPTIKFSALELSDFDSGDGDPRNNLPTFVASPASGGASAQVNVASTHFYSTCNQSTPDAQVFATVPGFANDVQYFNSQFSSSSNPNLSSVAVWVTENNVNADFAAANGNSTCNPGQKFVLDERGTSAFFAAWRPYVYSQLAKAGNQALYHWDYDADAQFSEVDYNSDTRYLSYWVDQTLGQMFPVSSTSNPQILSISPSQTTNLEVLATKNPDGSYVVMIANYAVKSPSDNNGTGAPLSLIVDVSALGNYSSASQITLDASTNLGSGPDASGLNIPPAPRLLLTLTGYGTLFLHILP
jgi:hypothetical protein